MLKARLASTRINIEVKLGFECGCASQLKPPATSGITHRRIDRHSLHSTLCLHSALLPFSQRHNVVGFDHAKQVSELVLNCRVAD